MTTKHGITSAPTLHVQCRNPDCPRPADATINLPTTGCDQVLTIVEG